MEATATVQVDLPPAVAWAALCDGLSEALETVVGPAGSFETRALVKGKTLETGATYRFTRRDADDSGTPFEAVWTLVLVEAEPGRRITWRKAYGEAAAHDVQTVTWTFESVSGGAGTLINSMAKSAGALACCGPDKSRELRLLLRLKGYLDRLELPAIETLQRSTRMIRQPSSSSTAQR